MAFIERSGVFSLLSPVHVFLFPYRADCLAALGPNIHLENGGRSKAKAGFALVHCCGGGRFRVFPVFLLHGRRKCKYRLLPRGIPMRLPMENLGESVLRAGDRRSVFHLQLEADAAFRPLCDLFVGLGTSILQTVFAFCVVLFRRMAERADLLGRCDQH